MGQEHQSGASDHRYALNSIKLFNETNVLSPTSQCGWSQNFKRSSLAMQCSFKMSDVCYWTAHPNYSQVSTPWLVAQILLNSLEISLLHYFFFFLYFPESSRSTGIKKNPHPILPPACVALPTVLLRRVKGLTFTVSTELHKGFVSRSWFSSFKATADAECWMWRELN